MEEIADPIDSAKLEAEVDALLSREDLPLAEKGPWKVLFFRSSEAPQMVKELGRLRELTFRSVGEGTGLSRDNDEFDNYYHHLVVWHSEKKCIAGAYRIGMTDEIISDRGIEGLYTHTLFRFKPEFFNEPALRQSVELGRSFVVPEFQGRSPVLILLFRGLAKILLNFKELRGFFGTVSLSEEYSAFSKQLMARYLMETCADRRNRKAYIDPTDPYEVRGEGSETDEALAEISSTKGLDEAIRGIDGVGAPPLLHIYSTMSAKYIAFNTDVSFNSLDALIYVDISELSETILDQYFKDNKAEFKAVKGLT